MPTLDDVYRKFGETSEAAQKLEQLLRVLLSLIGSTDEDSSDFKFELFSKEFTSKKTFGQILNALPKNESTNIRSGDDLFELLKSALAARNRLMHSFFPSHGIRSDSEEGREIMMADLQTIHDRVSKAYARALSPVEIDRY